MKEGIYVTQVWWWEFFGLAIRRPITQLTYEERYLCHSVVVLWLFCLNKKKASPLAYKVHCGNCGAVTFLKKTIRRPISQSQSGLWRRYLWHAIVVMWLFWKSNKKAYHSTHKVDSEGRYLCLAIVVVWFFWLSNMKAYPSAHKVDCEGRHLSHAIVVVWIFWLSNKNAYPSAHKVDCERRYKLCDWLLSQKWKFSTLF